MTINRQMIGTATSPTADSTENDVLGKLVNHTTTEEAFQESLRDVAVQVDRDQQDIGYNSDPAMRDGRENRSINTRLDTVENALGISDDNMGAVDSTMQTLTIGGGTGSDISGPLSAPQIIPLAVGTMEIASGAVTREKIAANTITTDDISLSAGITRTQLEGGLQTYDLTIGDNDSSTPNLGDNITVPNFTAATADAAGLDGVVQGPEMGEVTTAANRNGTGTLWVLGSDNNWHQLNEFARNMGGLVPANAVDTTFTTHRTTAAVPTGTTDLATVRGPAFLAVAAQRLEPDPMNPGMTIAYGLDRGDLIVLTDTTPTPNQVIAYVYVGESISSTEAANTGDIIPLGVASTYGVADSSLTLSNNNFRLSDTIPNNRDFSGSVTFSGAAATTTFDGNATFNGNVALGNGGSDTVSFGSTVTTNITPNGTRDLGTMSARWNTVYAGTLNANTITGPITDSNIACLLYTSPSPRD